MCSVVGKKVKRGRNAEVKVKNSQNKVFHSQYLLLRVCVIGDVDEILHVGWINLLIFPN